jgi:hypothetical protein
MDHDRRVAGRTVEMWLDDLQREGCGYTGVEGVAAPLQNSHTDRRRNPVRAGDHAERALDLGPRGEPARVDEAHMYDLVRVGRRNSAVRLRF